MATYTEVNSSNRILKQNTLRNTYIWTLSFLRPYIKEVILFIAFSLIITGIEISIPKLIQYFVDVVVPHQRSHILFYIILSLVFLLIGMFFCNALCNRLQVVISEKTARDLQFAMFDKLRALGFSYYEKHPTGETLSLFNTEVRAVQQIYHRYFPRLVTSMILVIVAACLMVSIHIPLSLIVIPCFLSYYLIGPCFEKRAAEYGHASQEKRTNFNQKLYDSVSALLELRASRREEWDHKQVKQKQKVMHDMILKQYLMNYSRGLVRRVTVQWGAVAVFAYGAYLVFNDQLSIGAFIAFVFYYFLVISHLTTIVTNTTEQKVLMFQANKIYQFMQEKEDVKEAENPITLESIEGHLKFCSVDFGYPSIPCVINDFNISIKAGEKVAFVGTSGNGKSTLIKLIGRFYDPGKGEILLDGVKLKELALQQLRESLGFVFQETYLFGDTVMENIRFGNPEATDEEVRQAAKSAYADEFINDLQDGYNTYVGERGIRLSGGQKQRIAIARMFVKNPKIILLDEATSALDNESEYEVQQALQNLFQGRTTIAIAHRLSTVRNFDRIVVVDNGKNVEEGTYDKLLMKKGSFYQLVNGGGVD
ncbi:ABC transporter ATP-binding protein [Bacillus niameyensis]|uniref:ABC transporter ATP-binding protein n=1 Tax=Bacillus niameyensis TaxID=1522308 RepID=UPI00078567AE|nr:ABC transporter ATP-binding protein [Bacillus niameyensis]